MLARDLQANPPDSKGEGLMLKIFVAAALGAQLFLCPAASSAVYLPIAAELFTIESTPGVGEWTGNSLTLDISVGGPLFGGFVQTPLLSRAQLPANIIGISFDVSSTLANPRISFGWNAYDTSAYGMGSKNLNNYIGGSWDLTTWYAQIDDRSSLTNMFLGAAYNPFSLEEPFLHNQAFLSLDFRADGWNGLDYLPGSVTFHNIQWLVTSPTNPQPVPSPQSFLLLVMGILYLTVRRGKIATAGKPVLNNFTA
jgi:hypothetical protein